MRTISISVLDADYEAFRRAAEEGDRSIAQLIREAMAFYRAERIEVRKPLLQLPLLEGHRALRIPPKRQEIYEEVFHWKGKLH